VTEGRLAVDQIPMTALGSDEEDGRAPVAVTDEMGTSIAIV
jgi:hypothetical protein